MGWITLPQLVIFIQAREAPQIGTILWSDKLNIPILSSDSDSQEGLRAVASDLRPVFLQEKRLLELLLGYQQGSLSESSVWSTTGNRLIVDGEAINLRKSEFMKRDLDSLRRDLVKSCVSPDEVSSHAEIMRRFVAANTQRLKSIQYWAEEIIAEAKDTWPDRIPVVSFSGGKDSTVVSHLVRKAYEEQKVMHVFGDTTLELPTTYEYVRRFHANNDQTPLRKVGSSQKFMDLCERLGPPSRVMRWCCTVFKTGPISARLRAFGKGQVITYYGVRRGESVSRSSYDPVTSSPKASIQTVVSPIIDWLDSDVWLYLLAHELDFNSAYKMGFSRVGCWCCPSNSKWSFFLTRIYYPEYSEPWREYLIKFAEAMGKPDPENYVDSGYWKARQGGIGVTGAASSLITSKPCGEDAHARWYELTRPVSASLYEYFKPFGRLDFSKDNPISHDVLVTDRNTGDPVLSLQAAVGSSQLRVAVVKSNDPRLLLLRVDCQLRKYQSCILCGGCSAVCPFGAISVLGGYHIDETKCIGCLECINHFDTGCLASKVLQIKRVDT